MAAPLQTWLTPEQQEKCQRHVAGDAKALCDGRVITRIQSNLATISEKIAAYTRAYDEVYALADQLSAELQRIITKADVDIAAMQARLEAGIALSPAEKQKLEERIGAIESQLATTAEARDIYKDLLEQLAARLQQLDTQAQALSAAPFTAKSVEPFQGVLKTAQGWAGGPPPPTPAKAPVVTAEMQRQLAAMEEMEGLEPTPALVAPSPAPPPILRPGPPQVLKPAVTAEEARLRRVKEALGREERERDVERRRAEMALKTKAEVAKREARRDVSPERK